MKNKVAAYLLSQIDEMMPMDWRLPTQLGFIDEMFIEYGNDEKNYLVLKFIDTQTKNLHQICSGHLEHDPAQINEPLFSDLTIMRMLVHPALHLTQGTIEYVTYSYAYTSQLNPFYKIPAGELLASIPTDELKIAFISKYNYGAAINYLDPAIIVRLLAVFNESYAELLYKGIKHDWENFFYIDQFIAEFDATPKSSARHLLLKEALRQEYVAIQKMQADINDSDVILVDPDMEKKYTDRIGHKLVNSATSPDILFSFPTQVAADNDKFASYFVEDLELHLAIFPEDEYDMELIDRRVHGHFSGLAEEDTGCKIIINGPLFDSGECGMQPIWKRGYEYLIAAASDFSNVGTYKGLTKGTLYMNEKRHPSDCPIPDDPDVWRYYFAQKFNGNYEFKFGRLPVVEEVTYVGNNPDPTEISVAIEPLYGVFREGKRIGAGHEIDTDRNEPDSVFANADVDEGIPIIGKCFKEGHSYIFILMRSDSDSETAATWEQIITFMRDLGVIDAGITDGASSVGLIIDDKVVLEPGITKNTLMPLAIGFNRRSV